MAKSSKSKFWWFAGLFLRLLLIAILGLVLAFFLLSIPTHSWFGSRVLWSLMAVGMIAGYAWAIYFRSPFFPSRTSRRRFFIAAAIAVPAVCLACLCVIMLFSAAMVFTFTRKTDHRTESVTLPSGEVLENHTYCESGWPSGGRYNELFLKNPATGTSERVDANGNLDYAYALSLLEWFPHPQEVTYGDEKILVIGPYLCQRIKFGKVPDWNITSIDPNIEAQAYLKSFLPTNNILSKSADDIGLQGSVPYVFDRLDLTNNILTLKKQIPEDDENWRRAQHGKNTFTTPMSIFQDQFPPYLVYDADGFNGGSIRQFPLKFDLPRTKAKNGPLWDNLLPPDSSSITVESAGFGTQRKMTDVTAHVIELLQTNSDGFTVNVKTLGFDPFPGRKKHLTIKYEFKDLNFTSTVPSGDELSYQTLINNARK